MGATRYKIFDKEDKLVFNNDSWACFAQLRDGNAFNKVKGTMHYIDLELTGGYMSVDKVKQVLVIFNKIDIYKDRLTLINNNTVIRYILIDEAKEHYNNFLACMIYLRYMWESSSGELFYDILLEVVENLPRHGKDFLLLRVEPLFYRITGYNTNHMLLYGYYVKQKYTMIQLLKLPQRNGDMGNNMKTMKAGFELGGTGTMTDPEIFKWDKNNIPESIKKYKELYKIGKK